MRFTIPDASGDTAHRFDLDSANERAAAEALFDELVGNGRSALALDGDSPGRVADLDTARRGGAAEIFFAPHFYGG